MHRFLWKSVSETLAKSSRAPSQISSSSLQSLRLFSSISTTTSDSDCCSYNNCTKQESSLNRPPSCPVLKFFQDSGFSQIQAESIVSRYPIFLQYDNPEKTLKPKISFLHSIGIPEAHVAKMVTNCPLVLCRSLDDHLISSFDSLKILLGGEHNAISSVKRCPSIFNCNPHTLAANLSTLRKHGVPESNILRMVKNTQSTGAVDRSNPEWFCKIVESVMKMGFDTSSVSFVDAITAMGLCNESTWEDKLKFYQGLGFSRDHIFSMFRKQPASMSLSRKKVGEAVEFYNDKFHWGPPELAMRPQLLGYSLHSRIIPRSSALQVLWSKNMITKRIRLVSVLVLTDKVFLEKYVTKHAGEVPEVLDAYQGKLLLDEFTFDSGKN